MNFENELIPGVLIKRYKRFFADVKTKNGVFVCHCPNTGSMMGLLNQGANVWITKTNNEKRKLKYTLQIIEHNQKKVGVNTHLTNDIFYEALRDNKLTLFGKDLKIFREQKINKNTRIDFLVDNNKNKFLIEVKNVTLSRRKGLAEFPDAITQRGQKHIKELITSIDKGFKACLVFVVQREDCKQFKIAGDIDNEYFKLLNYGIKKKLKIICYDCKFNTKGILLNREIKFDG